MEASLAKFGPISIGVAANSFWQMYKGGVLSQGCDIMQKNHGVLLVGYGTDPKSGDFWKIRNSWSAKWGEKGYVRLKRGINCNAILTAASTSLTGSVPKGMCLEKCGSGDSCCFGECCANDGSAKCCENTGCCSKEKICCGKTGGGMCCGDEKHCCG